MWRPQLTALAGRCRLIAPDLPGFGGSAAAAGVSASPAPAPSSGLAATAALPGMAATATVTMAEMAAAVVRLLDSLGVARAVVCGLSMGGYVALALCAEHRERVAGLVLADTRATADDAAGRRRRLDTARAVEERGSAALIESLVPKLVAPHARTGRPDLVAWLEREVAAAPPAGVAAAQRGMAERPDRTALLPGIAVPTLVLAGEDDQIIPAAESAAMSAAIPGARLATLPGAGHLSNLEQPEAFNRALLDLLAVFGADADAGR